MDLLTLIGTISDFGGAIAAVASAAGLFVSLRTRRDVIRERERQNEEVKIAIILAENGDVQTKVLPILIRRREVNRAELQGRLANALKNTSARYSLRYLAQIEYQHQIYAVQDGVQDRITIPCSDVEFAQFV